MTATILLIDDQNKYLAPLAEKLREQLGEKGEVVTWIPKAGENPLERFDELAKQHDLRLVVTDYDLTTEGQLGFFGSTVVDWCQKKSIPVGDFSRRHASSLAEEPNMFELRVPLSSDEATIRYIGAVFLGFTALRTAIDEEPSLLKQRSPAAVIARILGAPRFESQFGQYSTRYGGANSALVDNVASTASKLIVPEPDRVARLLTYIGGHLLVSAILRFPGPIVDQLALCSYLAVEVSEASKFQDLFQPALYTGPFAELGTYRWTDKVDEILGTSDGLIGDNESFETSDAHNRRRLEIALKTELKKSSDCDHCNGEQGGFFCPFTKRTVCQRADCSVASTTWIPAGARLARFERDFYDEWSPILGM